MLRFDCFSFQCSGTVRSRFQGKCCGHWYFDSSRFGTSVRLDRRGKCVCQGARRLCRAHGRSSLEQHKHHWCHDSSMVLQNIFHGSMSLDQLYFSRPTMSHCDYRCPIPHLYLCGSGAHPGAVFQDCSCPEERTLCHFLSVWVFDVGTHCPCRGRRHGVSWKAGCRSCEVRLEEVGIWNSDGEFETWTWKFISVWAGNQRVTFILYDFVWEAFSRCWSKENKRPKWMWQRNESCPFCSSSLMVAVAAI